jgi:hypothetical protein
MSQLTIRRLIVWGISLVLGFISTWASVVFLFPSLIPQEAGKGLADYGVLATILTVIPLTMLFVAWLDYFLDARIHSD